MTFFYFLVSFLASGIGALSGIGGGVIIKPLLDATNTLSVTVISFLSSCTVLSMSAVSFIRNRESDVKIDIRRTTFLAIGAAIGGITGKLLFDMIKRAVASENTVGLVQTILLFTLTFGVFIFVCNRNKIKTIDVMNPLATLLIGLMLGNISSFLGIGGGPLNIAVLLYFFSLTSKQAAVSSIYVIFLSQIASLMFTIGTQKVPQFDPYVLVFMILGGVLGAFAGTAIMRKISTEKIDAVFKILLIALMALNAYNIVMFSL